MKKAKPNRGTKSKKKSVPQTLACLNANTAGIDIGATSHFVAVSPEVDEQPVREFASFTQDLHALADWLKDCQVNTVAMESTGVYWIPLYEVLERRGFEVLLVNARHVKNVRGRKTDVQDCQWLQQLHSYGLLESAFRPNYDICELRTYVRQKERLTQANAAHIQHMQKALTQMNLKLQHVISDITGKTGMRIIKAIVAGERNPAVLAQHRDKRCKSSLKVIEKALTGHYQDDHVFVLSQSLALYEYHERAIEACGKKVAAWCEQHLPKLPDSDTTEDISHATTPTTLQDYLTAIAGSDLTKIPGLGENTVSKILGEVGCDMSAWKSAKHFTAWMGLAPNNKVSGGKRLSTKTPPCANRAAAALRMAASTLSRNQSALGAYFRRLRSRLGPSKAITATARKLATIIFYMLRDKVPYQEMGQDYYEQQYQARMVKNLRQKAAQFGFQLQPQEKIMT